jgi:hypothetical protein
MLNYLIDFKDQITESEILSYLETNGCTILKNFQNLKNVYHVSSASVPPLTDIVEIVTLDDATSCKLLEAIPVQQLQHDNDISINISDTQNWWKIYSLMSLDLSKDSITIPRYGKDTAIYVVDSGIDITHPEFTGKDVELLYSFTNNFTDTAGHGTALASLMVGNTCGLTDSTIKVVKIFDKNVPTRQSDMLSAFDAIITDYTTSSNPFAVVNLSWSIQKNTYIEQKIQNLINMGVIVVASAGNSGHPIADVTPASMSGVMTIGAYNSNFAPCNFSDYTGPSDTSLTQSTVNHGALDAWAPGENIYCATLTDAQYGYTNGTSAAAAIYSAQFVYNLSQSLTNDKDILPHLRDSNSIIQCNLIQQVGRTGLLDLTDPKYSNSVNKICTYADLPRIYNENPNNITTPVKIVAKTGQSSTTRIFITESTASYEFLTTLPEGVTVINNFMYYSPTIDVVDVSGVETQTVEIKITQLDGSTYNNNILLVHVGTNFNADNLPPGDPLIDITLQFQCYSGYCFSCGYSSICCSFSKYDCNCLYLYCY